MLRLSTTTDKIQVILGGAIATNQLDCVATYKDINVSAAYTASAPSLVATNGSTAVDLVGSPASDTQRFVDFISVFNTDTANATVTIRLNRNGVLGVLFRCVLGVGELISYTEGQGWVVHQNNGSIKNAAAVTDGSVTPAMLSQPLTLATSVASTSGTSIDFTGIPSWVKRITIMFDRISTNTTAVVLLVQIGSGSITNTGYASQRWAATGAGVVTSGFDVGSIGTPATNTLSGMTVLSLVGGNLWVSTTLSGFTNLSSTGSTCIGSSPALSGALDRVRITSTSGTAVFDAGTINILYE